MQRVQTAAMPERHRELALAALASVFLHATLLFFFTLGPRLTPDSTDTTPFSIELMEPQDRERMARLPETAPAETSPAEEDEAPPSLPKTQIVAPPDGPEAVPDEARYLSEKDSRAEQEMVKRGEPAPPAPPPGERARPGEERSPGQAPETASPERAPEPSGLAGGPRPDAPSSPQASDLPGLESLFAKPSDLLDHPKLGQGKRDAARAEGARDLASLGRPDLWADPGERGTPDYLPDVRDGSFTLLNTKADLFAPFVRRVGLRVFQTFSMSFKRKIFAGTVPAGREKIEVQAVMSRDGRRVDVVLKLRNGNLATDRVLLASLSDQIFFDENPPAKAVAEDGRIHFVFAIDSAVWYGREENGGVRPGAQWVFGAGLL